MEAFSVATRFTLDDWRAYQRACAGRVQHFLTSQTYELGPTGLRVSRHGLDSFADWSEIKGITATPEHLFLWIDRFQAFLLPVRDLPAGCTLESLQQQIERWIVEAKLSDSQSSGGSAAAAATASNASSAAVASAGPTQSWAASLARLLTLRRVSRIPAHGHAWPVGILSLVSVAVWFALDWLGSLPDPTFYVYGFPAIAWYVLMLLAVAAVAARLSLPAADFGRALLLVLAVTPVALIVSFLIGSYLVRPWDIVLVVATVIYLLVYAVRALIALTGNEQPRAIAAGILTVLLFLWTGAQLYVDPTVWVPPDDDASYYDRSTDEAEALLFSQPQRIDAALAAVEPSDDSRPDMFFLGFAGFGEQRVFAEEIKLAAQVVGDRYGSVDRSVLLVNDRRDLNEWPLASPTALKYALRGIASKMSVDKDILFLSLSSHGSEDASLSVTNGALMLHDLTAPDLAVALDGAGIKWRVIVISACYSGSFIEELQNPQTVVITASAADRTSFGCADDRDLTYFGEAFYRDALPKARSLREAFATAKADIAAREKRERITSSRPQAFFGNEIDKKLEALERRAPAR